MSFETWFEQEQAAGRLYWADREAAEAGWQQGWRARGEFSRAGELDDDAVRALAGEEFVA